MLKARRYISNDIGCFYYYYFFKHAATMLNSTKEGGRKKKKEALQLDQRLKRRCFRLHFSLNMRRANLNEGKIP